MSERIVELGPTIKRYLEFNGMTQSELAEKTGINRVVINRLVNGRASSFRSMDKIQKIARAFNTQPRALLNGIPPELVDQTNLTFGPVVVRDSMNQVLNDLESLTKIIAENQQDSERITSLLARIKSEVERINRLQKDIIWPALQSILESPPVNSPKMEPPSRAKKKPAGN